MIIAVSDGAGSAKYGAIGSAITTTVLFEQITSWLGNEGSVRSLDAATVLDWLNGVRASIAHEGSTHGHQMRDYAATLLLAIIDDTGSAFAQIGDGAIVTSNAPGEWKAEIWPQRGLYANETHFVTDDNAHETLQFTQHIHPHFEVAVFSDGLERVLLNYAEHRAHGPVFEKMFHPLRCAEVDGQVVDLSQALSRYLQSPAVSSRTDDDVTLVIASRLSPPH